MRACLQIGLQMCSSSASPSPTLFVWNQVSIDLILCPHVITPNKMASNRFLLIFSQPFISLQVSAMFRQLFHCMFSRKKKSCSFTPSVGIPRIIRNVNVTFNRNILMSSILPKSGSKLLNTFLKGS